MKVFNIILVAALAAFANAAAVANPEAAVDSAPLEKRCRARGSLCNSASDCCSGGCVRGTTVQKLQKHCA
ncbi:hypothetical protein N7541_007593 [Penicillium brevicompactum]|uniref:Uncharacterized protein n=1 Tax=Penicillium brevicompactum TaxID=5074 RepID=A0A9W9QXF0_PENBR|nr:uncharacterized protein N7506_011441 [Penicillium brevicompactum]KAJ5322311.1 hypothetical protein N7506_011441 [Penicillium brevicompactum]KAJ5349866.1 hypothetical protein N7541_007593 [Penicillium brevicompactum]